jgi:hypothetical protein
MIQQAVPRPPILVVARASVGFLLQCVRAVTRHVDGDILGGITVLALLQGTYAHISQSAEGPRGDGVRPVSVQSLARSLRTPPETMRRCVARLIALGWCERISTKGIVIADNAAARAQIDLFLAEMRTAFFAMLIELKRIDFDFDIMGQAAAQKDSEPVEVKSEPQADGPEAALDDRRGLALDRAMIDFGLRIVDGATPAIGHDYSVGCVFCAILSANASPFAFDPQDSWRYGTRDSLAPDEMRRPVPLAEISQMLGVPYETVRRYVNALIACGDVVRDERKGLLVPSQLLMSPRLITASMEIARRFVEMTGELKRLGFDFHTLDGHDAPDAETSSALNGQPD